MPARIPIIIAVILGAANARSAPAAEPERPRYLAALVDGTRLEGRQVTDWGSHTGAPKLDGHPLDDKAKPLRWLWDRELSPASRRDLATGFVELTTGDRLPGRVVGFEPCETIDTAGGRPHLLLTPLVPLHHPEATERQAIRVLPRFVRRVVWGRASPRRLAPGTLVRRDGRRLRFRGLRFEPDAVAVLLDNGVEQIPLAELSEICFPRRNPWTTYYEELAILNPDGPSRLFRVETSGGLVATGAEDRFRAVELSVGGKNTWYHAVRPAWSPDLLWVPFDEIRMRLGSAPHEVPLSRVHPVEVQQRPILGRGWHPQADRNVQGGPLVSGGQAFGWGIGVHAPCTLFFELPETVRAFRARAGLDRVAGEGGCARAAVFVNHPGGTHLYQSPHLIGSGQVVDTGVRKLAGPKKGQHRLVLLADAAERDHPPTADPLDIRDTLDWLEPILLLDPAGLKQEVESRAGLGVPAWDGWTASLADRRPPRLDVVCDDSDAAQPRWVTRVDSREQPLALSARRRVPPERPWLLVQLRQWAEEAAPGRLEVRVDGRAIAAAQVDALAEAQRFLVSLRPWADRNAELEVVYVPGDGKDRTEWQALALVARQEGAHWIALKPVQVRGTDGATFAPQDDGSILVGGEPPFHDLYTVMAKSPIAKVTAVRVEALLDASLPNYGPGWAYDGNFVLSRISLELGGRGEQAGQPVRGRYVRIDLPKPPLSLAEVQVTSEGKNVARAGAATQSSTAYEAPAELAIDGNPNGDFENAKSCSHTAEPETDPAPPWWEVDLGEVRPIDSVTVWNRNSFKERLANFTVSVLDAERQTVWKRTVAEPPDPVVVLDMVPGTAVPLSDALANFSQDGCDVAEALEDGDPAESGWAIGPREGRPHAAVFLPEKPIEPGERPLVVKMRFLSPWEKHALGRFRLSVTADEKVPPPPADAMVLPELGSALDP